METINRILEQPITIGILICAVIARLCVAFLHGLIIGIVKGIKQHKNK